MEIAIAKAEGKVDNLYKHKSEMRRGGGRGSHCFL